ncbi:unnamed protein product [Effrenium voratum]|uniref:Uncharacterized protein n=1 Tax=Effrenium voratum TaxID=2562239 RepID=A0AA36N909_9DINO|nr:unnamed protein product [Effrenium voratum]CAJ1458994.1 unnamed protein product [Effrenium voratum]
MAAAIWTAQSCSICHLWSSLQGRAWAPDETFVPPPCCSLEALVVIRSFLWRVYPSTRGPNK